MKKSIFTMAMMVLVGFANAQSVSEKAPSPAKKGQATHQTKSNPQNTVARTNYDAFGAVVEFSSTPKESSPGEKQAASTHAISSTTMVYQPSTMAIDAR
jgi:hypothetical protein